MRTPALNRIKNRRHRIFVLSFAAAGFVNARAACIDAGFAEKSAASTATRLLQRPDIEEAVDEQRRLLGEREEAIIVATQERILQEYTALALQRVDDFLDWDGKTLKIKSFDEIDTEKLPAIRSMKQTSEGYEIQFWDKTKALEALAKIKGMLTDVDVGVEVSFTIKGLHDDPDDNENRGEDPPED